LSLLRAHAAADSGIRAEVRDRKAPVLLAQHLLAVVDDAVHQLARGVLVHSGVRIIVHPEQPVKIARHHTIPVHHLRHHELKAPAVAAQQHSEDRRPSDRSR